MRKIVSIRLLFLMLLSGCSAKTALPPKEEVEKLLFNYLEAIEDNNISALVKYSDDLRFPDKKEQRENYLDIDSNYTDTKVIELINTSPTEFAATIEFVDDDTRLELTFPIQQQKNKWKVIVGQTFQSHSSE